MKQCLGKHAERRFNLFLVFLLVPVALILIFAAAERAFAVPSAAPTPITVTDQAGGTALLNWSNVPASGGGTITYKIYRDLSSTAVLSSLIVSSTAGLSFTDTRNAYDGGNAGDTAKDSTGWDATNERYGQTYKYTVLALDSLDSKTNWDSTTASTIEVKVHWSDAKSPTLTSKSIGPENNSKQKPSTLKVRVGVNALDWFLGVPAAAVIKLKYTVNGTAQADELMSINGTWDAAAKQGTTYVEADMKLSSAPNDAEVKYWIEGQDSLGNVLQSTGISPSLLSSDPITFKIDSLGLQISDIEYTDVSTTGAEGSMFGISSQDKLTITFDENITVGQSGQASLTTSCFELGRMNPNFTADSTGSFGSGASITTSANQVIITFGTNPKFKFAPGTAADLINAIRYNGGTAIRDSAGNSADSTTGHLINKLPTAPLPVISANPVYTDTNNSGTVNGGDHMIIIFSKPVVLSAGSASGADFTLPVTDDNLTGAGAFVTGYTARIDFTLQNNSFFTIAGVYNSGSTAAKQPSGIDVSLVTTIMDEFGNKAAQTSGNFDIAGASTQGPRIATAVGSVEYRDIPDSNGVCDGLSANDTLSVTFDKPIMIGGTFTAANSFSLPVQNDNLDNPAPPIISPSDSKTLVLTFGGAPNLTVYGTYSGATGSGSPSGLDILNTMPAGSITDIYGNKAESYGTPRDITSADAVGASISTIGDTVLYYDNAPAGVSQGDYIEIEFNKPVILQSATTAAFQASNLTLGSGATVTAVNTGVNNRKVRITLGSTPVVTFTGATRSQIDVANATTQILNWKGTAAVSSSLRNIVSSSTIGGKVSTAVYTDVGNDGLNQNDTILLTFDKPVKLPTPASVTAADFQLLPAGGSLGGAGFSATQTGVNSNQVKLILGANPNFVVAGVYGTDASATGIDIVNPSSANIVDEFGNNSIPNTPVCKDISGSDSSRPTLTKAEFTDTATPLNGITAGDTLTLTFSRAISASASLTSAAFQLPVTGDSLGTFTLVQPAGASPAIAANQIRIQFTSIPTIKVAGIYSGTIVQGSSSGIDISASIPGGMIADVYGNTAINSTVKDIGSTDTSNPVPVAARYTDIGNDGVNAGDILELDFSKPILANPTNTAPIAASHFSITNGNLGGTGLAFAPLNTNANNITIKITLGSGAALQFNPPAAQNSTININDGSGALQSITDVSGNGAVHSTPAITIAAQASGGPSISTAVYTDVTNDGVTAGDILLLTFNKTVTANNPTAANFTVPANNGADSLGTSPSFSQTGVNSNQVKITLGANPKLTIIGVYSDATGKASGININAPNAPTIIDMQNQAAVPAAQPVDITGVTGSGPQITKAIWCDVDKSGTISSGDTLAVTFNKAIVVPAPPSSSITRTLFNVPVSGDYLDFTAYANTATYELTLTLGGSARFIIPGIYNNNNSAGQPSGIDIIAGGVPAGTITDVSGNVAIPSSAITDIGSADSVGPTLLTAVYSDFNNSNSVDSGDHLTVTFSKPITINNPVKGNFNVQNGSLGNNPQFSAGPMNTQLLITLDSGVNFTFFGASTSSIDIVGTITTITDVSGNSSLSSTLKYITAQSGGQGPLVNGCVWIDNAPVGVVSSGDVLKVTFDKDVVIKSSPSPADFVLPVAGDSLGTGVNIAAGTTAKDILITLGTGAYLTIKGVYSSSAVTTNSPSGIDISTVGAASGNIVDLFGYNARQNSPVGKDITSNDTAGPRIISALYEDVDTNGVTINDKLILTFDKNITSSVWINNVVSDVTSANFSVLPSGTGNIGASPTFLWYDTMPAQLIIKLGNNPVLTIKGVFPTDSGASGIDVSGTLTSITDISGNGARVNSPGIDIGPIETVGPYVTGCRYVDANNSKAVDQGDTLYMVFSKPVVITNPVVADFKLPVTNDTLGGLPSFGAGNNNRELKITLGSAPVITPAGIYSSTILTPGSPSGIDAAQPNIASVTDIYGNHCTASSMAVDIDDGVGPSLVSAVFKDVDGLGVNVGDTITLTFTEPVSASNVAGSDFTLPVANDTFGAVPKFVAGPNDTQLTITLGTSPVIMVPGVYSAMSLYAGASSGINISSVIPNDHITDKAGNKAIPSSAAIDITGPSGEVSPTLVSAKWQDMNGDGVSQGDRLDLLFDKPIYYKGYQVSDYKLPVSGDTLGSVPSASVVSDNNKTLRMLLGASPKLTIPGIFNSSVLTSGSPSGIDVTTNLSATMDIMDVYGNPATASSVKDIIGVDTTGPILLAAVYYDPNGNGVDKGDVIGLEFDKSLQVSGTSFAAQFAIPVPGDSLGVNAQFSAGTTSTDIRITLGLNPFFTVAGVYNALKTPAVAGDPSGIGCSGASGAISDYSGNAPQNTTAVDIISASLAGPQLMFARIDDVNNDLIVSAGDRMVLTFNKPVKIINPPGLSASDFLIPVSGDSFGAGATFEVNAANSSEILIGLQSGVKFRPDGTYISSLISAGSPSGIGIKAGSAGIKDYIGNSVVGGTVLDIADTFSPFVVSVRYEDVGNNGMNRGDRLYVKMSKQVLTSNMQPSDFSLTEALDSLGTSAYVTQNETDSVMITLGDNPRFKVAGIYPTDAGSSGLDISLAFVATHIQDVSGNAAKRNISKDIYSSDTTRPAIIASRYGDSNSNGIVDAGDTLSVVFSKAITINGVNKSDFNIINGSFGTGGLQTGTQTGTNEIVFILGNAPVLVVEGVYPADPNASAIDISSGFTAGHISDIAGNNPSSIGYVDIQDFNGPVITTAVYYDIDANGVTQGDLLRLKFSRSIVVSSPTISAFILPVSGDSFGSSPTIGQSGSNEITITLGVSPTLKIAGTFMSGNTSMGSPSGVNVNNFTSTITDASGNPARALPSAVDITGSDTVQPTLASAVFEDIDGNGISANDKIILTFSEMIMISNSISIIDFSIASGSLGDNPRFASGSNSREMVITLGSNPVIALFGATQTAIGRSPSTYITGHVMDVSGNDWASGVPVLVTSKDITAPVISAVKFVDVDNMGITAGDRLDVYFNKAIIVTSAQPADFVLPVAGDSFGLGSSVSSTADPKAVSIILGTGATFVVRGIFSPAKVTAGSPSGFNLAKVLSSVTSIAGIGAKPHSVAIDITSDDITSPKFMSAETEGGYGKNIIKARGDSITLTAILDDPSLRPDDITADLSAFGLGKAVAAQSFANGVAAWAPVVTPDIRGTIEVAIKAVDVAGNISTYSIYVSVIMPVEKCVAEILPANVLRKSGARDFTLLLKPTFRSFDTGLNKIVISVPKEATADKTNFTSYDMSQSKVYVNGRLTTTRFNGTPRGGESVVIYEASTAEITVLLGEKVNQNTSVQTVEITFRATVPEYEDEPFGKMFGVKVDDTNDPASVTATGGDVNGIIGDSDGLKVTTTGVKILYVTDKVVITPSFWKVIFSIKFNSDMNAEKPPRVTFRPTYTLQNEQNLTLMSFVDGLYMGYAVVPFEAFGFNGEYLVNVYDAQDYMGNSVNTLTLRQRFSPKFMISAFINPLDEKSLIISTKYVQSATNEALISNPVIKVSQDGTNETQLSNVQAMSRPNVYKGYYTISPEYAGRAQIEVEGRITPNNTVINGKSIAEFTSSFIPVSAPSQMVSLDDKLRMNFSESTFERDVMVVMTPDFTKISKYMSVSGEAASPKMYSMEKISELKLINEVYQIYPEGLKAKKPIEVTCDLACVSTEEIKHAGLFALEPKTGCWELISKDINGSSIKAGIDKLSSLAVFSDSTPPALKVSAELADKVVYDKFDIELSDNGAGIDIEKIRASVNGRLMKFDYDAKTSKLTLYMPERTMAGIQNVSLYAADKLGNVLDSSNLQVNSGGFFDVVNYVSYPNPAKTRLNISYTLGKNISDMNIRVYDVNGQLVYDFGDFMQNGLTAGRHSSSTWTLVNNEGDRVGNGVYFYKITAIDTGGDKIERFGKIAVLK